MAVLSNDKFQHIIAKYDKIIYTTISLLQSQKILVAHRTKMHFFAASMIYHGRVNMKKLAQLFSTEDTRIWLLMNVIIVVAVPIAVRLICFVAEIDISWSAFMSDCSLAALSVAFNIGVFIFGEIPLESPPQLPAKDVQDRLAEDLIDSIVEESREKVPNKLLKEVQEKLKNIFQTYLTESSLKSKKKDLEVQRRMKEKEYQGRIEKSKQIIHNGIYVFLCAAGCALIYGVEVGRDLSNLTLLIHLIMVAGLLWMSARWGIKVLTNTARRNKT